jgi:FlaA1/EpsC-like NDP-sugar epimerase/lipopolysaccharide/colanic/teichoic acid biosynthesis glycosyltransferase
MLKRALDIAVSLPVIALCLPFWLVVAIVIRLDSPGPILYRAQRAGKAGRPFAMFKFRTMVQGAAGCGPGVTRGGDRRITRVGRILRDLKIDETPQFLNVLRGEMSLIGPRPEDPRYVAHYTAEQRRVLSVRPGIAGPAAIQYRHEEKILAAAGADPEAAYLAIVMPEKLRLDLDYVDRQSLAYDLRLLIAAALSVLRRQHPLISPTPTKEHPMLTSARRIIPLVVIDALIVLVSLLLGWLARAATITLWDIQHAIPFALVASGLYCAVNWAFTLYHRLWRYASAGEVADITAAAGMSTVILLVTNLLWPGHRPVPVSVVLFAGLFSLVGFVAVRYRARLWSAVQYRWRAVRGQFPAVRTRVLIFGAGEAGQLMAWRFLNHREGEPYQLIGFVDDDPAKLGMRVHGLPILGSRQAIPDLVAQHRIDLVILAVGNISRESFRDVLAFCERAAARVKVLPDVFDFIKRTSGLPPIRDLTVEDLLGRRPVQIDSDACRALLAGKTVLVTGAAGSIGSELCRQIASYSPRRLLMLDNNESGLFDLMGELEPMAPPFSLVSIIGDVTDRAKVQAVFARHRPQIVFHAAAYKHVPLMEEYPEEAVRVNVLGTLTVADLACHHGAERFVLISSDKAVSPSSVMGASKRIGEMLVSALGAETSTLCTGVRFGNVLGSRGSVLPIIQRQIENGGPITITHPEMTRYFMSISEAVSLVIQAAAMTQGSDLFLLDMGQPLRIEDLVVQLIRLRGLRPGTDIPIRYIGTRPGEKLREELTADGEAMEPTSHPMILRVCGNYRLPKEALYAQVDELVRLAETQRNDLLTTRLWEVVAEDGGATA